MSTPLPDPRPPPAIRLFYCDLSGFDGENVSTMAKMVKLVDNFDSLYSYITNDGRTFWFRTNMDAPKYKASGRFHFFFLAVVLYYSQAPSSRWRYTSGSSRPKKWDPTLQRFVLLKVNRGQSLDLWRHSAWQCAILGGELSMKYDG